MNMQGVQELIGRVFTNEALLDQALLASGVSMEHPEGNKRLALVGNTVAKLVLQGQWIGTGSPRSEIDDQITRLLSRDALVQIGRASNLDTFIRRNPAQRNEVVAPVVLSDSVLAILAATWMDSDLHAVEQVMRRLQILVD